MKNMGLKTTFRSLKYRNFRLFFGGQSISLIGTWIQRIAIPWLVYDQTNSVFMLGLVGFVGQLPTFILSPFAGVISDRLNRYHLLIATQILSMIQASVLAILVLNGHIQIWEIILLISLFGCINAFDVPTRQSFMVQMVDKKEDLGNAIALNSTMVNGARLLGPSIAGVLIASMGEGICFLINAISYLFVIGSLLAMHIKPKELPVKGKSMISDLREGFSYTFGMIPLRNVLILLALVSLVGMPYAVLMPVFVKETLHEGSHMFGFLMGASGLGALTGALYLASRKNLLGLEKVIPVSAGIFGLGLVVFSFSNSVYFSMGLMVVIGLGMMLQMATSNTLLQTLSDDKMRGRVMSFYAMAFFGTAPFGSFLAGVLAKSIGVPQTFLLGGILCLIGAAFFALQLPVLKRAISQV